MNFDGNLIFVRCLMRFDTVENETIIFNNISGVPRNFFQGGVQQIQLRTEDREDGDLGAVAP